MYSHGVFYGSSMLLTVSFVLISVIATTGRVLEEREWKLVEEDQCLAEGGICVMADHCEETARSNTTGLCLRQDSQGVCCFEVPKEASCRWHGGECMEDCGQIENAEQKDCADGKKCCPLLI